MNDSHDTEINLTKIKLEEIVYDGGEDLKLKYLLNGVSVETTLTYPLPGKAREDYQMLVDMLNASETTKQLLQELKEG
tara:strand:+ start:442 stop:675 length:234 start_codon:yes stop_codon:yes gene_type:complete